MTLTFFQDETRFHKKVTKVQSVKHFARTGTDMHIKQQKVLCACQWHPTLRQLSRFFKSVNKHMCFLKVLLEMLKQTSVFLTIWD